MPATLSIIIPALNEVANLPLLLHALQAQTRPPEEIIVADAGSKDGTVEAARRLGVTVVPGGKPGPGRNAGARAATGDLLLFLDADVAPPPDFLAKMVAEFEQNDCVVATALMELLGDSLSLKILVEAGNVYMQALQYFSPHAPGFCILARRETHEAIHGFDEAVVLAEDFDYVQRAAKFGRFAVLTGVRIPVSMRRVEEDGFFEVALKYVWCEFYALAGKPIYSVPFEYKFGAHLPPGATASARRILDIGQLREQLGRFENPLQTLSAAGRERLERLARRDWLDASRERLRLWLEPPDAAILHRYLLRRLELIRQGTPLRAGWSKLKTLPQESIHLLDFQWLRSHHADEAPADEPERDA